MNNFLKYLQSKPEEKDQSLQELFSSPNELPLALDPGYRDYADSIEKEPIPLDPLTPHQLENMPTSGISTPTEVQQDNDLVQEETQAPAAEFAREPQSISESSQPAPSKQSSLLDEYKALMRQRDDEIKSARESDSRDRKIAAIANVISTGMAGKYQRDAGSHLNYDAPDIMGAVKSEVKTPGVESDYKTKIDSLLEQYKIMSALDKNSGSQKYAYMSTPEGIVKVDKETGDTELAFGSQLAQNKDRRNETDTARRGEQLNISKYEKPVKAYSGDKSVVKANEMFTSADTIQQLVNSDNPIGHAAIPTFMARAAGEVGALSEGDKAPFGGSRGLTDRIKQTVENYKNGQLTPENKKFIMDLTNVMKKQSSGIKERRADEIARQYRFVGKDSKELKDTMLGAPGEMAVKEAASSQYTEKQERGIEAVMKANGYSREQAIKVIKEKRPGAL